jgi:tubulin delta
MNSTNSNKPITGSSTFHSNDNIDIEKIYKKIRKQYQRFFNIPYFSSSLLKENTSLKRKNSKVKEREVRQETSTKNKNEKFSFLKLKARAILVDSEVKVIKSIVEKTKGKSWQYEENNIYHEQIGAANNWSFGYYIHGPKAYEAVKRRIKAEVENCINFDAFLVIQSLAGGTGSGLGSYFTEKLRKDYPYSTILNLAVWPYQTGEVVVQNYNILLSIAHLYKYSDAIMLIYNSELHSICSTRLNYKTVSFQHINNLISDTLVNIFLNKKILPVPATNAYSHANSKMNTTIDSSGEPIWLKNVIRNFSFLSRQTLLQHYREHHLTLRQFIDQLCPLPTYKILSLKFVPQSSTTNESFNITNWNGLLRTLSQMALTDRAIDEKLNWSVTMKRSYHSQTNPYVHFIGNILILRGRDICSTPPPSSSSLPSSPPSNSSFTTTTTATTTTTTTSNTLSSLRKKKENFDDRNVSSIKKYNDDNTDDNNNKDNNEDEDDNDNRNDPTELNNKNLNHLNRYKNRNQNKNSGDQPSILLTSQPYFNYNYPLSSCGLDTKLYTYYSNDTYNYSQSAYLISNSTAIIPKLEEVMTKVSRMYNTKAYIYQYNKYGLTNEHFERMMLDIEQILYDYKKLIPSSN